jgi:hypothetical protein
VRPKLSVVVTCTERKSTPATPECQMRNLPEQSLTERHDNWVRRLDSAADKRPLSLLYAGEAWRRTTAVVEAAVSSGFAPTLFVASAGLGLVEATTLAPSYGATFTTGHADSVANSVVGNRDWWGRFSAARGDTLLSVAGDATIVVLSEAYASALDGDLAQLAVTRGDCLLVGGSREVPGLTRLRSDLGLRGALKGTAGSLNVRMAEKWLRGLSGPKLTDGLRMEHWVKWAAKVRRIERYDRETLTDAQVMEFIEALRSHESAVPKTRALRILRDSGCACEQARFTNLFARTVTA